jgi:hypothetical protein
MEQHGPEQGEGILKKLTIKRLFFLPIVLLKIPPEHRWGFLKGHSHENFFEIIPLNDRLGLN